MNSRVPSCPLDAIRTKLAFSAPWPVYLRGANADRFPPFSGNLDIFSSVFPSAA